ncbi:trifunctional transcriptional regulator/proline dehydrogenase/L-glutamate gamma-semialdehyde dehydrogenase, partial [Pseudomonas syringae]
MATTTLGVKLDDPTRERLKAAAHSIDRTPPWLIKQAIFNYLEKLESGATLLELNSAAGAKDNEDRGALAEDAGLQCFLDFAESIQPQSVLRAAITSAYRRPEQEVVPMLPEHARTRAPAAEATHKMAAAIDVTLRHQKSARGR